MAMMRPQNYEQRAGLYMLEPYDPDRIPVIFVHGLMSVPQQWVPTIAAIESDPVLHGRYQFWAFAFPTGDPILISSLKLRESLEQVYKLYPKTKDMVLISYSLGGLLALMQAVTTHLPIWQMGGTGSLKIGFELVGVRDPCRRRELAYVIVEDYSLEGVGEARSRFDPSALEGTARRRHRRHSIFGPPDCRPFLVPVFGSGRPAGGRGLAEDQLQNNCSRA